MTLTEAREILSESRVREALELLISVLPYEPARPSAKDRAKEIRNAIAEAKGFDPFATRSRDRGITIWRYCTYYQLRKEGFTFEDIGRAVKYGHSIIIHGYRAIEGWLETKDRIACETWKEFIRIMDNG